MKANEFVKNFGWEKASTLVGCSVSINQNGFVDFDFFDGCVGIVNVDDLKRLVESWGLVERVGGLDRAKEIYQNFECIHINLDLISCRSIGVAIANVESCQ